jgi:hypothetical protein
VRSAVDGALDRFSIEELSAREAAGASQIMYHI